MVLEVEEQALEALLRQQTLHQLHKTHHKLHLKVILA
jgi:hypothetical protein